MLSSLTLLLTLGAGIGVGAAPEQVTTPAVSHFTSYTQGYREAQRTKKPLLLVLNPGADAGQAPLQLADVQKTEHRRKLLDNYVVVVVDTTTKHGAKVHELFESKPLPHVSVIDRDQKWQVFRTSRQLQGDHWNRILETFQTGDSSASLNLDPQDCPTCRLGLSYYSN